jgi:hypothetical protein
VGIALTSGNITRFCRDLKGAGMSQHRQAVSGFSENCEVTGAGPAETCTNRRHGPDRRIQVGQLKYGHLAWS